MSKASTDHSSVTQVVVDAPLADFDSDNTNRDAKAEVLANFRLKLENTLDRLTRERTENSSFAIAVRELSTFDLPRLPNADQNVIVTLWQATDELFYNADSIKEEATNFNNVQRIRNRLSLYPSIDINLLLAEPGVTDARMTAFDYGAEPNEFGNALWFINVPCKQSTQQMEQTARKLLNLIANWVHGLRYNSLIDYCMKAARDPTVYAVKPEVTGYVIRQHWAAMQCNSGNAQYDHTGPHRNADSRHEVNLELAAIGTQQFVDTMPRQMSLEWKVLQQAVEPVKGAIAPVDYKNTVVPTNAPQLLQPVRNAREDAIDLTSEEKSDVQASELRELNEQVAVEPVAQILHTDSADDDGTVSVATTQPRAPPPFFICIALSHGPDVSQAVLAAVISRLNKGSRAGNALSRVATMPTFVNLQDHIQSIPGIGLNNRFSAVVYITHEPMQTINEAITFVEMANTELEHVTLTSQRWAALTLPVQFATQNSSYDPRIERADDIQRINSKLDMFGSLQIHNAAPGQSAAATDTKTVQAIMDWLSTLKPNHQDATESTATNAVALAHLAPPAPEQPPAVLLPASTNDVDSDDSEDNNDQFDSTVERPASPTDSIATIPDANSDASDAEDDVDAAARNQPLMFTAANYTAIDPYGGYAEELPAYSALNSLAAAKASAQPT
jgi:hypothetical protein